MPDVAVVGPAKQSLGVFSRVKRPSGQFAKLYGRRFGELTALYPTTERRSASVLWVCQCDCGLYAVRAANYLLASCRSKRNPCCAECLRGLRSGLFAVAREANRLGYSKLFRKGYGLYGITDLAEPERDDRDDRLTVPLSYWELWSPGFSSDLVPDTWGALVSGEWAGVQLRARGWTLLASGLYRHSLARGLYRMRDALKLTLRLTHREESTQRAP